MRWGWPPVLLTGAYGIFVFLPPCYRRTIRRVGVKNGINFRGKKNFLGTFVPPFAVLNDFQFLTTLDDRDWRAGIAEAIKVALIKDANFWQYIEQHADALARREMAPMQQLDSSLR